jgi:hypothetical protein
MLSWRVQLGIGLLVGLLAGGLIRLASWQTPASLERKAEPFVTQRGMLAVSVRVSKDGPPEILGVQALPAGRASIPGGAAAEYSLELLDGEGRSLHRFAFRAVFLLPGNPPRPVDELRQVWVVPGGPQVRRLQLSGPGGQAEWDLE